MGLLFAAVFLCILLHEFGHALMARRFGVKTLDIILLPIGGLARLTRLPEKPIQEFLIALAGPLVNVGLAVIFLPSLATTGQRFQLWLKAPYLDQAAGDYHFFLPFLLLINVGLAVFNMIPAFPMDGGRVLRALLATRLGRLKATRIAVFIGQIIAVGMLFFGVWEGSWGYVFMGIFIYYTASQEKRWVEMENVLSKHCVGEIVRPALTKVHACDTLKIPLEALTRNMESSFLVFDENEKLMGILTEGMVLDAVRKKGKEELAGAICEKEWVAVQTTDTLKAAEDKMRQLDHKILPVFENEQLVGLLDTEMVNNFLYVNKHFGER